MPAGRAWAGIDTIKINGHPYMVPDRFEPMRNGRLELIAAGLYGPSGESTYGLEWQDSIWVQRWGGIREGYIVWPTLTPPAHQMLVWKSTIVSNDGYSALVTADVVDGVVTTPDTVARVDDAALAYTGTSFGSRKWIGVRDQGHEGGALEHYRFFRSDTVGSWREVGLPNNLYCYGGTLAMAATSPESVLVVMALSPRGVVWGWINDTLFTEMGVLDYNGIPLGADLRPRPSGGFWLFWGEYASVLYYRSFRDGSWSPMDTLRFELPGGAQHQFYDSWPTQDDAEYPAVMTEGFGNTGFNPDHLFVSMPTDSGFGVGERVPGTLGARIQCIGMDENGDVWLAWWVRVNGMFVTHSHTTSTCATPVVGESEGRPSVSWRLSEPSPRTWWAVMRSEGEGPFERVARIRAGASEFMSWVDSARVAGQRLRYAIRRECRDVRYQWTSEAVSWEPRGPALDVVIRSANPVATALRFEIIGAASGEVEALLYDLQGRVVARARLRAGGSGVDSGNLELGRDLRSGIYLLRVRGGDARLSDGRKLVVIR